jgi:hypothetical protein
MDVSVQDLFISHASADKLKYVNPLADSLTRRGITFWLDSISIEWGQLFPLQINEGLKQTRHVLLCLSENFINRSWPESELASALAIQSEGDRKRVLPLILNERKKVLAHYPLLASLAYKEYSTPELVADEIAKVVQRVPANKDELHIIVESVHTGQLCNVYVSPRASVRWLADRAQRGLGVSTFAQTGAYVPFIVKWVLVDTRAEAEWAQMPREQKQRTFALVAGSKPCYDENVHLGSAGVRDGIVFHLHAIEDVRYDDVSGMLDFDNKYKITGKA